MKTRYELALDAAAVEMGEMNWKSAIINSTEAISIHTRAAEIFAMVFAEWKEANGYFITTEGKYEDVNAPMSRILGTESYTKQELLTLYNQSA